MLLQLAASLEEAELYALTVEQIASGEDLPDELFRFDPPAGAEVIDADEMEPPASTTLEQAVAAASFTVLAPTRIPERTSLHVSYQRGSERPRLRERVYLVYAFTAGEHSLLISQLAENGEHEEPGNGWVETTRSGVALRYRDQGAQREVELDRLGTRVRISSDLELELLVELALSLEPAPSDPPALRDS